MIKNNKKELMQKMIAVLPEQINGADKADIFVYLAIEMGMTHLLYPEALPEIFDEPKIPETAPELYSDRLDKSERPAEFIMRVYADWLGTPDAPKLAKHHLLHLDKALYNALHNWLLKNDMPECLFLPSKKELNDIELSRIGLNEGDTLPYPSYYKGLKHKLRLYNAARNRRS